MPQTVQFPQCKHLGTYSTHKQGFLEEQTKQVKKAKLLLKPNVAMQFPFLLSAAFNWTLKVSANKSRWFEATLGATPQFKEA